MVIAEFIFKEWFLFLFLAFLFSIGTEIYYTRKFYTDRLSGSLNKYVLKRAFSIGLIPVYLIVSLLLWIWFTQLDGVGMGGLGFAIIALFYAFVMLVSAVIGLMIGSVISSRIVKKHSVVIEKQTTL